jgi:hypothetical protein
MDMGAAFIAATQQAAPNADYRARPVSGFKAFE